MDKSFIKIIISLIITIGLFVLNAMTIWNTGFSLILIEISSFATGYFIAKRNKKINPIKEEPKVNKKVPEEIKDAEARFNELPPA